MSSTCATCPKTINPDDDTAVCPACARDLRAWLRELPTHTRYLPLLLAPGASPRTGQIRASRAHPPLPLNETVLSLTGPGHATPPTAHPDDQIGHISLPVWLTGWADHIAVQHPAVAVDQHGTQIIQRCQTAAPADTTVRGWCHWLLAYLPTVTNDPGMARDFRNQLGDLMRLLRRITGDEPNRTPFPEKLCPTCDTLSLVSDEWRDDVVCSICGGAFTTAELERAGTTKTTAAA